MLGWAVASAFGRYCAYVAGLRLRASLPHPAAAGSSLIRGSHKLLRSERMCVPSEGGMGSLHVLLQLAAEWRKWALATPMMEILE